MHDLAVIVVSTDDAGWLEPCLRSVYEHAGAIELDVVVADNESTDGTGELVRSRFPDARVVSCANHGFGHANNRALMTCDARHVLFLNPDTEIRTGTLSELVALLDRRPEIGLVGAREVTPNGTVYPTIRRFPTALRAFGEAIGSERLRRAPSRLGTRVLDLGAHDREVECDWVPGAFMCIRAEALLAAGIFDERFFMSSEEVDLALRIRQAGWRVLHVPVPTILHHVHMGQPLGERMQAQYALARRQYADKHFSGPQRALYLRAVALGLWLRMMAATLPGADRGQRAAARRALRTLRGTEPPPYGEPPATALRSRATVEAEDRQRRWASLR